MGSGCSSLQLSATSQLLIGKPRNHSAAICKPRNCSTTTSLSIRAAQLKRISFPCSNRFLSTSQKLEARMAPVKLNDVERKEKLHPLIGKGWSMVKDRDAIYKE